MVWWGVVVEPVAVEEVCIDVVADTLEAERSGVGARLGGMPDVKGGLVGLTGERVIILRSSYCE